MVSYASQISSLERDIGQLLKDDAYEAKKEADLTTSEIGHLRMPAERSRSRQSPRSSRMRSALLTTSPTCKRSVPTSRAA
jgi:hypothetical protein